MCLYWEQIGAVSSDMEVDMSVLGTNWCSEFRHGKWICLY